MPGMPVMPMLAVPGELPNGAGWAYEFKWDGVRAIASIADGRLRLFARSGSDITPAYPELYGLGGLARQAVLDGEIVVLGPEGAPSPAALGERMHVRDAVRAARLAGRQPVTYMIFDLLMLDGVDWSRRAYVHRRAALHWLTRGGDHWLVPPHFADGPATFTAACEHDLEGVVAKRLDSVYRPGQRSTSWVKVNRPHTAEFVVGAWRAGDGGLGALLVGVPGPAGLEYRGRIGGGIPPRVEGALLAALPPLAAAHCPFAVAPPHEDTRDVTWVRPELVVEIRYAELTRDGRLRFPTLLRMKPDRAARAGGPGPAGRSGA